ncbi:MAG TPA: L,D-transpeptidase family protein [Xanthobacteraceae bacterium]|nr:L,D-transpeptidase family protein [Xanthobacteraceae bacterium]
MPNLRFDRLLAQAAILLLLAAGGAPAQPTSDAGPEAAAGVANEAATAPPAKIDAEQAPAKPTGAAGETETAAPAETAESPQKPAESADQPSAAVTATPVQLPNLEESAAQPAAPAPAAVATPELPKPEQAAEEPVAPAAAVPAAQEKPAAATGEAATATTSAIAPATQPAAGVSPDIVADAPISEQLRGLAEGKFDRIIGGKKERSAIDAFYSGRNYAPLWISDGKANARARAAIAYLGQVDADGLDPADYPVPNFASLTDPAALASAEIKLTSSVLTYARHAQLGRVHWSRVSGDIFYDRKPAEAAEILANMADAKDIGEALGSYEPQSPAYLALKAKLALFRAGKGTDGAPQIANGPVLKLGMEDERVPLLRERLGVPGDVGMTYDKALADAVKKFQQEHELKPSGTLTAATVEALNGRRPDQPVDTIIANMERWRWMPHDLGETHVIVNLPDFTLHVFHDGREVWTTRIVVGKPTMPTPIMSAEMKFITVNPTWNVPPSIVANEYLPALERDPTVLDRAGLVVSRNADGTIHISQPPGERNALGRLRFNFPNKFLVYQHDTPDKNLFALDKRAFSHGCMRVQDPTKYAEVLLSLVRPGEGYSQDRIRKMFGGGETDIQFPSFVPVHLTYQTAFVDEKGKLEFREDVYGRDKALLAVLKGDERKVADIPIERKDNAMRRQVLAIPDQPSLWGGASYYPGQGYDSGPGFFARLFGGVFGNPQPPASIPHRRAAERRMEIR